MPTRKGPAASARSWVYPRPRQLGRRMARTNGRRGVRDDWAGRLHQAETRIVECNPKAFGNATRLAGFRAKISPASCRRPGGSLPPPGPPLAIFSVAGKKRHEPLAEKCG